MDSSTAGSHPAGIDQWIGPAQAGSREALGLLLEACRDYLLLIANQGLSADLRAKAGASDLVQQTFLEAQRDFPAFRGRSEAELLGWLRRILLHNMANVARQFRASDKRQIGREVTLDDPPVHELVHGNDSHDSPSSEVAANEQDDVLRRAIDRLPEDYRLVIRWRSYERLEFAEVGRRLGRSPEAARKLWARAVEELKQALEPPDESS